MVDKPNTAIAQAYYNKQAGITRLATETGAGQWGSSLALAGALFEMDVSVYMVKVSYHQKPYRRMLMETYGARCVPSPSPETAAGRAILAEDPDCPGSLGIATSEALEVAGGDPATNYAGGSVLNHVLLHQSVIGQEAIAQFALAEDYPGHRDRRDRRRQRLRRAGLPVPRRAAAWRPAGARDRRRTGGALGHSFMPPPVHAGGLRYHGMAPLASEALKLP